MCILVPSNVDHRPGYHPFNSTSIGQYIYCNAIDTKHGHSVCLSLTTNICVYIAHANSKHTQIASPLLATSDHQGRLVSVFLPNVGCEENGDKQTITLQKVIFGLLKWNEKRSNIDRTIIYRLFNRSSSLSSSSLLSSSSSISLKK